MEMLMMNDTSDIKRVPEPAIRRLPLYRRMLLKLKANNRPVVSCTHIAEELHLLPIQVRKDIAMTGIVGKPRVGYEVDELINAIEEFLGWKNDNDAFLVGAGNLGSALLGYKGFRERGLNIVAAFDNDPAKVGKAIHGVEVLPLDHLDNLAQRMHVQIGVLTVDQIAAQDVANYMVLSGIRAIWNFTQVRLDVPRETILENVDLSASLAVLSSKLTAAEIQ